jgi:hypothetical protein
VRNSYNTSEGSYASSAYAHNGSIQADVDQNGSMDLIRVTCSPTCRLGFIKDWKDPGAFETCIAPTPYFTNRTQHASVWDWNGDGLLDIMASGESRDWTSGSTAYTPFHLVLTREPGGTFILNNTPLPPSHFTFNADLDRDGRTDLVVPDTATNTISMYRNMGGGLFEMSSSVAYDSDQYGELSHAFTEAPAYRGRSSSFPFMDVDGDGALDMVRYKQGSGWTDLYYQPIGLAGTSAPVHWIVLGGTISVYSEALFMDLELDNDMDLVVTHGNYMRIRVNNGPLPITAYTSISLDRTCFDFIPMDADGDGRDDILMECGSNAFHVIYNENPPAYRPDLTFRLFPNPSSGEIGIDLGYDPSGNVRFELFDAMGRTVHGFFTSSPLTEQTLSHLNSGIYLLRAHDEVEDRTIGTLRLVLTRP